MPRARTKSRPIPVLPEGVSRFFAHRLSEIGGLVLVAAAAGLVAAALGYHPGDPSFNSAASGPVQNPLGVAGSYTADLALQTLGLAGLLPAAIGVAWGLRLTLKKDVPWVWVRLALLLVAMPLLGVALAHLSPPTGWPVKSGLGGVIGAGVLVAATHFVQSFTPAAAAWMVAASAGALAAGGTIAALGFSVSEWGTLFAAMGRGGMSMGRGVLRAGVRIGDAFQKLAGLKERVADLGADLGADLSKRLPDVSGFTLPKPGGFRLALPNISLPKLGSLRTAATNDRIEPTLDALPQYMSGQGRAQPLINVEEPTPNRATMEPRTGLVEPKAQPRPSKKALAQRQKSFNLGPDGEYLPPPLDLLEMAVGDVAKSRLSKDALEQNAKMLSSVLADFGVLGEIVKVRPGPVVTLYELVPAPGTKTSRVIGLADDIARSMSAVSVRVAVVPGQNVIGIELPNVHREMVYLRELLESVEFNKSPAGKLNMALGKDIGGAPMVVDLARMPHLLISGTTGSGKSVGINTMILSLLYQHSPEDCRFIMIDPKMLELSVYQGIPHLLTPVVTNPGKAVVALKWTVREMEDRYKLMSQMGVRNIAGYNKRLVEARKRGEVLTRKLQTGFDDTGKPVYEDQPLSMDPLPFIVVVVDEMADLMLVAGKDIEGAVQRLAQMARAAGIHLIMATQRPSVDVITGTIKANFPTRVAFQVTSRIDSRTILGEAGAEHLLGQGDMLYMAGGGRITRVHGPFVSDEEVEEIVSHLKAQGLPSYIEAVTEEPEEFVQGSGDSGDELYEQAVALVAREGKASTSFIQRHLQIGYNRAARIIEQMEKDQVVSPANRVGRREVLVGAARDFGT